MTGPGGAPGLGCGLRRLVAQQRADAALRRFLPFEHEAQLGTGPAAARTTAAGRSGAHKRAAGAPQRAGSPA